MATRDVVFIGLGGIAALMATGYAARKGYFIPVEQRPANLTDALAPAASSNQSSLNGYRGEAELGKTEAQIPPSTAPVTSPTWSYSLKGDFRPLAQETTLANETIGPDGTVYAAGTILPAGTRVQSYIVYTAENPVVYNALLDLVTAVKLDAGPMTASQELNFIRRVDKDGNQMITLEEISGDNGATHRYLPRAPRSSHFDTLEDPTSSPARGPGAVPRMPFRNRNSGHRGNK